MRLILTLLMLVATAALSGASPALAHNELIGSEPSDGARVTSSPARVVLIFDLPVKAGFSTVTVTGPDRTQWQAGTAVEDDARVSAPVRALGPTGQYTIAYQVLSVDGHPVRGAVHFTLTNPGNGIAAGSNQPSPRTESSTATVWPWLAGSALLLLVAGVAIARRAGR